MLRGVEQIHPTPISRSVKFASSVDQVTGRLRCSGAGPRGISTDRTFSGLFHSVQKEYGVRKGRNYARYNYYQCGITIRRFADLGIVINAFTNRQPIVGKILSTGWREMLLGRLDLAGS